jgi:hypothetical protein
LFSAPVCAPDRWSVAWWKKAHGIDKDAPAFETGKLERFHRDVLRARAIILREDGNAPLFRRIAREKAAGKEDHPGRAFALLLQSLEDCALEVVRRKWKPKYGGDVAALIYDGLHVRPRTPPENADGVDRLHATVDKALRKITRKVRRAFGWSLFELARKPLPRVPVPTPQRTDEEANALLRTSLLRSFNRRYCLSVLGTTPVVIDLLRRNHSFAEAPVNYKFFSHTDFLNANSFVKLPEWREGALARRAVLPGGRRRDILPLLR